MNVFCFAGNITKDIDLRSTSSGKSVASFSVAINEGKDKTTFINCVAWEKTAELISQYCQKGDRLSGTGRLENRTWEKDGQKHYATDIVIVQFDFPPKRNSGGEQSESPADDMDDQIPF